MTKRPHIFDHLPPIASLDMTDPLRINAETDVLYFNAVMSVLLESENTEIRELCKYFGNLLSKKLVAFTIKPQLDHLNHSFYFAYNIERNSCGIMMPLMWHQRCKRNPLLEFCNMIAIASKATDFYNGKFDAENGVTECVQRSKAFEVTYLLSELESHPDSQLVETQVKIMKEFPNGVTAEYRYERKPIGLIPS